MLIIGIEAFNEARTLKWPPPGFTTEWFERAFENTGARDAFLYSLKTAAIATSIALVLGTLAAMGVSRFRFFGREAVSFLVILPIALPGIVTGIALNSTFTKVLDIELGLLTLVIAHATFCIVVIFNNVVARLRRLSTSFEEASADLGASPLQTFRWVTLPNMRTALVAGALLAFALSFDEIIVTVFTIGVGDETLPQWLLNNFSRPQPAADRQRGRGHRDPALDHPRLLRPQALERSGLGLDTHRRGLGCAYWSPGCPARASRRWCASCESADSPLSTLMTTALPSHERTVAGVGAPRR